MPEYKIIIEGGQGEIVEKKSRFIANIIPVNDEKEATEFIDSMKKKYWDAKHNCSAFVIGPNNEITRCSDDGEPSGTAGRPMLEVLIGQEIHNAAVVVTRYFGGVLLGTGGLVRAYQGAVKEGIANCKCASQKLGVRYTHTLEYNDFARVQSYILDNDYQIENTDYSDKVIITAIYPVENHGKIIEKIIDLTNGKVINEELGECKYLV